MKKISRSKPEVELHPRRVERRLMLRRHSLLGRVALAAAIMAPTLGFGPSHVDPNHQSMGASRQEISTVLNKTGAKILKFAAFNIAGGRYGIEKVAETIREEDPDIVALQEATAEAVEYLTDEENTDLPFSATSWNYDEFGNAVLSREPIVASSSYSLFHVPGRQRRSLLLVDTSYHDTLVQAGSFHMTNDAAGLFGESRMKERLEQAAEIRAILDISSSRGTPMLIGGDANAQPGSEEQRILGSGRLSNAAVATGGALMTFHGFFNDSSMDIMLSRGLEPLEQHTRSEGGSDHYELITESLFAPN